MPSKITKLTPEDTRKWLKRINLSLEWRKPYEEMWDRTLDYLKGLYFDELDDEDKICVNMVRPHVNVVIPAIYSRNPDIMVFPRRRAQFNDDIVRKRAEGLRNLLRYLMDELDLKTEIKLCLLDAVLTGSAWNKQGYETEFAYERAKKRDRQQKQMTVVEKFLGMMGMVTEEVEEEEEYTLNEKIVAERPWALRVSPYDMIIPTLSRRPEELSWIGERFIVPYDCVMDNDNFDTEGLKPSVSAKELLAQMRGGKYKDVKFGDAEDYVIYYEVWDGKSKMVHTIAEDHDRPLLSKKSEYTFLDSKYHSYVQLRFNEIPDEFFPQGDIIPAEPQIKELNSIRTQMNTHRKRYNRRYIGKPGALEGNALRDLQSGEDGTYVEVSPTYAEDDVRAVVAPISDAPLPAEVYAVENKIKDDMFTILGTSDYASSAGGRGARTATEASIIATQSKHKVEERIDAVNTFVARIIRNLAMICQRYLDTEQAGMVLGDDAIYWVQLQDRREIRGEFLYKVIYGSTTPVNREVDREQYLQFYTMTRDDPYYDQVKLRLQLNRKFDLENPEQWLVPAIAQELDMQRMLAVKQGLLLGAPQNALQPGQGGAGVNGQAGEERLPTGQPRGLPGDLGGEPSVPGGKGGTDLGY